MTRVHILVGTEMGTAQDVADAVQTALQQQGIDAIVNAFPEVAEVIAHPEDILLICTSNTGSGDLPGNIQPFYLALTREFPDIAGRRYGVINLGDSSYATFGEAGEAIDEAMADIGAERIGEPLVLDACSGDDPTELALEWLPGWVAQL